MAVTAQFEEIFPRYYWEHQEFQLHYELNDLIINVGRQAGEQAGLTISCSDFFTQTGFLSTQDQDSVAKAFVNKQIYPMPHLVSKNRFPC